MHLRTAEGWKPQKVGACSLEQCPQNRTGWKKVPSELQLEPLAQDGAKSWGLALMNPAWGLGLAKWLKTGQGQAWATAGPISGFGMAQNVPSACQLSWKMNWTCGVQTSRGFGTVLGRFGALLARCSLRGPIRAHFACSQVAIDRSPRGVWGLRFANSMFLHMGTFVPRPDLRPRDIEVGPTVGLPVACLQAVGLHLRPYAGCVD